MEEERYISVDIALPKKEGEYTCLVDCDGLGSLVVDSQNYFTGKDWCRYQSNCQYITHWLCEDVEEYNEIFKNLNK